MDQSEYQQAADRRQGVNKAVIGEVAQVFQGKSAEQLSQLQKGIEQKLIDKQEGTDIGYWESLLSELKAHLARARLKRDSQYLMSVPSSLASNFFSIPACN